MNVAKTEITDKKIFNKIKASLNRNSYVECGLCGAIRVEADEMARVINSFIDRSENADNESNDFYESFLGQIIASAPDDLEGYVEFLKWKDANERPVYYFLDTEGKICGYYDDLVIYCDPVCDCFSKEKIKIEI